MTCRRHRGLEMLPQWYQVPVFYFSNPVAIIGDGDPVWAPQGSAALDYELELGVWVGPGNALGTAIPIAGAALARSCQKVATTK